MSSIAPGAQNGPVVTEKTFSLLQALAIVLLAVTVFAASGILIGKKFFWHESLDEARIDEQLAYYEAKVKAEPKVPENRVNLGYTYFLKEKYDEAIRQFQTAVELDPKYYQAYYNMGLVYEEQKRWDDALEMFTKAAKLAPRDYKNFLQMGIIYTEMGKYQDAFKALNAANNEQPGSADILYYIGVAAEKSGDKKGAADMYKEALRFDPNYKEAKDALDKLK